jgi:hypothetical protein
MKSPDKAAAGDSYDVATRRSQVALLPLPEGHGISPSTYGFESVLGCHLALEPAS